MVYDESIFCVFVVFFLVWNVDVLFMVIDKVFMIWNFEGERWVILLLI